MKKILSLCFMLLISCSLFAAEYKYPISPYQDNYFIAGNSEDQTKFQISFESDLSFETGLYLGYTQTTWWTVYNGRDTMSANYKPEVFYRLVSKDNIFKDVDLKAVDYIQISPFYHQSTGVEGEDHRSINLYYGQIQLSTPHLISVGFNLKVFGYYTKDKQNEDIDKYKGYYENDLFVKLNSSSVEGMTLAELHFKHGGTLDKAWLCIEARSILFTNKIQPRVFIQYYYGYGENMVFYDKKEQSLYGGLVF